ncbi:MAG TPA: hypothetical protein DCE80_14360 [Ignavibacteriales bacterium]|nr:hypothetical protein [Ignavibacteriales bacterium]
MFNKERCQCNFYI